VHGCSGTEETCGNLTPAEFESRHLAEADAGRR
jgi:hypothetical protein